jgi:hypothetical protein
MQVGAPLPVYNACMPSAQDMAAQLVHASTGKRGVAGAGHATLVTDAASIKEALQHLSKLQAADAAGVCEL